MVLVVLSSTFAHLFGRELTHPDKSGVGKCFHFLWLPTFGAPYDILSVSPADTLKQNARSIDH